MTDIFLSKKYIEEVYLTFETNDAQIRKRQWSRMDRDICIIFLQKIGKQLQVSFEYLTVSLYINNKMSNKKIIS